jgi:hypothetical protein
VTLVLEAERCVVVASGVSELDTALAELQQQGLTVRLYSASNNMWYIADGGLYGGYVVSADELVALRRLNKLDLQGIEGLR